MDVPFRVGGIVEPPYFFDREEELNLLVTTGIGLTQNILLLAPRRYGKSSLLHNAKRLIEKRSNVVVVYINCREMGNLIEFCNITIENLLKAYEERYRFRGLLSAFQRVLHGTISEAFELISEVGGAVKMIGSFYLKFREKRVDELELLRKTFDFMHNLISERNLAVVMIYDEFQRVANFNGIIFELLKSSMDKPHKLCYFFSGSSQTLLENIFLREDSPLYLMVSRHYIKPLTRDAVVKFVKERFSTYNIGIDNHTAGMFHELTGGIPFYVQKLGLLCWHDVLLSRKREITPELVLSKFEQMLDEFDEEFETYFLTKFSLQQSRIVKAFITARYLRISEIARILGCAPTTISSSIARLVGAAILGKTEDGKYFVTDEVFRRWLISQFRR